MDRVAYPYRVVMADGRGEWAEDSLQAAVQAAAIMRGLDFDRVVTVQRMDASTQHASPNGSAVWHLYTSQEAADVDAQREPWPCGFFAVVRLA